MPRLPDIDEKQLTPEQRRIYEMVELVAAVGFYVMVAMTLNAFDVPVPGKNPLRDARQDN